MMTIYSPSKNTILIWHLLASILFVFFICTGSIKEWILAITFYFIQATIGGTITYHRFLSHKSFNAPLWFEYFGTLIGSLGGNGSGIAWAAVHREHHRFTDTEKDPHCPHLKGFLWTQFCSFNHLPNLKYVPDLLRNKFQVKVHTYYWAINFIYIVAVSLIDYRAVLYAYFIPALMTWHAGSFINTINHSFGYKNAQDAGTNNFITGYLVSGEGWHNNHHADPKNPNFSKKWYEFDLGFQVIKLLRK